MAIVKIVFRFLSFVPAGLLLLPLGFLFWKAFSVSPELVEHLQKNLLGEAVYNTVVVLISVLMASALIGTAMAWLVSRYDFFGKSFFRWALLLPLSMPAYVVAFVWLASFGQQFPLLFLIIVLSLCLYPYFYLIVLESFDRINPTHFEVAKSLGVNRFQSFYKIYGPILKPSLMSGAALVGMETLADFGTVSVFNVSVFTTLVYRSWFALQSLETAAFGASLHILFLLGFVFLTSTTLKGSVIDKSAGFKKRIARSCSPIQSFFLFLILFLFWSLVFVFPLVKLLAWSFSQYHDYFDWRLWSRVLNSLSVAVGTAFVTLIAASILIITKRYYNFKGMATLWRLSGLGYGLPGTVMAVGWMVALTLCFGSFHHLPLLALGTLVLGLSTRFFSLAQRPLANASERISKQIEESAQSSGASIFRTLRLVHWPLLRGAVGVAFLFVFIDTLKEMPMTLLMRPYGWDTLAVRVYQYTSDGLWQAAAAPSLVIIFVSMLPILIMRKQFL